MPVTPVQSRRLFQQVAEQLAELIRDGEFPRGERLPAERDLARQLGVSRPTVREAMIALELSGLVEVRMGSGVYAVDGYPSSARLQSMVGEIGPGPFETTEARRVIEGEAAALAAAQVTDEQLAGLEETIASIVEHHEKGLPTDAADRSFHVRLAQATNNNAIVSVVEHLWKMRDSASMWQNLRQSLRASEDIPAAIEEHRAIVTALRQRDPAAARIAMHAHLTRVAEALLQLSETGVEVEMSPPRRAGAGKNVDKRGEPKFSVAPRSRGVPHAAETLAGNAETGPLTPRGRPEPETAREGNGGT